MTAKKFGSWKKTKTKLSWIRANIAAAVARANIQTGLLLQSEIKKGLVSGSPAGKAFTPLAKSTINQKRSSKPLIDTRMLLNSVTFRAKSQSVFVGVLKTQKNKQGSDMANIAAVMEFGATIKKGDKSILIPARPFLQPVFQENEEKIMSNYRNAVRSCL